MKSYNIKFNLNERTPQTVYASKFSAFKVAIDVFANGERVSPVKLFYNGTEIASTGSYHDYTQFDMVADDYESRKEYQVTAAGQNLKLVVVTTGSDVSELSSGSGGGSEYVLPAATASTLGGIKVGDNLSITDGVLSAKDTVYTLPIAGSDTLGGIKIGSGLSVDENGKVDVTGGSSEESDPVFTTWLEGNSSTGVKLGYLSEGNSSGSVTLGLYSKTNPNGSVSIGRMCGHSYTGQFGIAIGSSSNATYKAISMGYQANANAEGAIQLGTGTNTEASSFYVLDKKIIDQNGNIPQARMGQIMQTVTESEWETLSATATAGKIYFVTAD